MMLDVCDEREGCEETERQGKEGCHRQAEMAEQQGAGDAAGEEQADQRQEQGKLGTVRDDGRQIRAGRVVAIEQLADLDAGIGDQAGDMSGWLERRITRGFWPSASATTRYQEPPPLAI